MIALLFKIDPVVAFTLIAKSASNVFVVTSTFAVIAIVPVFAVDWALIVEPVFITTFVVAFNVMAPPVETILVLSAIVIKADAVKSIAPPILLILEFWVMFPLDAFKVTFAFDVALIAKLSELFPSFKIISVALTFMSPVLVLISVWVKLGVFAATSKVWSLLTLLTTVVTFEIIKPSVSEMYVPPAPEIVDSVAISVSKKFAKVAMPPFAFKIKAEATISTNDSPPSMIEPSAITDTFPRTVSFEKIAPIVTSTFALYEISLPSVWVILSSVIVIEPVFASTSIVPTPLVVTFLFCKTFLCAIKDTEPVPPLIAALIVISVVFDSSKIWPAPFAKTAVSSSPPVKVKSDAETIIWPDVVFKSSSATLSFFSSIVASTFTLSTAISLILVITKASVSIILIDPDVEFAAKFVIVVSSPFELKPILLLASNLKFVAIKSISVSPPSKIEPLAFSVISALPAFKLATVILPLVVSYLIFALPSVFALVVSAIVIFFAANTSIVFRFVLVSKFPPAFCKISCDEFKLIDPAVEDTFWFNTISDVAPDVFK